MAIDVKTSISARVQALLATMPVGERLPGEHALARMLGTSRPTLRNVLAGYVHQGVIESRPGDGTYLRRSVTQPEEESPMASTIGVVIRQLANISWHSRVLGALQADNQARDINLVLKCSNESPEDEKAYLLQLWRSGITKIITFPTIGNLFNQEYHELIRTLVASGVRIVAVDNPLFGVGIPCVATDHGQSGYLATRHLIDKGHSSILIVGAFEPGGMTHRERLNGYFNALHSAGIEAKGHQVLSMRLAEQSRDAGYQAINNYLEKFGRDFTAIFATRDELAWGAMRALHEHNIRVPEEVSIVGFGDEARDEAFGVLLTSLEHPLEQIAHRTLELLTTRAAWDSANEQRYLFPARLIERESVRHAVNVQRRMNHSAESRSVL